MSTPPERGLTLAREAGRGRHKGRYELVIAFEDLPPAVQTRLDRLCFAWMRVESRAQRHLIGPSATPGAEARRHAYRVRIKPRGDKHKPELKALLTLYRPGTAVFWGRVSELSSGGCVLECGARVEVSIGELVEVHLLEEPSPIVCAGRVLRTREPGP